MEHIMNILRKQLLPYMTLDDIGRIDNAFINHTYRPQLLKKLKGVILFGDKDKAISLLAFEWLGRRQIYCVNMHLFIPIDYVYVGLSFRRLQCYYVDQFRYIQHILIRGLYTDDAIEFIVSRCPCLISINIFGANS